MKNTKKILLIFTLLAITALALSLVACGSKSAKLSFAVNGGTPIDTVEVPKETAYTLPVPSFSEEYAFSGWYLSEDFSGNPVTEVTLSEDATVYAKWEKLYAVNLNLNGGSLSTTKFYLKQGANVSEALNEYVPSKSGMKFGAWFNGAAEVGKNFRMPANALNLEAKYKAPYKIETYLQNEALNGYDKQEGETMYEYVGKTVSVTGSVTGFKKVTTPSSVESIVIKEGENLLKAYYERNKITVSFYPNYPDGSPSESVRVDTFYRVKTPVPDACLFEFDGYVLEGFSTTEDGEVVYKTDFLKRNLHNSTEVFQPITIEPERTTALYAVWKQGFRDMFGGDDAIFIEKNEKNPDKKEGTAYLKRSSFYFKGVYYPTLTAYNFEFDIDDENRLQGKVYENEKTFVYLNDDRKNYSSTLFVSGVGLDKTTQIKFDATNGVTYVVDGAEKGKGTYQIENGLFTITYAEGEMAGQTMCINIGRMSDGTNAFQIRNEEELALGKLVRFGVNGNTIGTFKIYQLEMDGFGSAKFYTDADDETKFTTYAYVQKDGVYTLYDSKNQSQGSFKIFKNNGKNGYMFYAEALDRKIEGKNGSYITSDGLYNLTYFDGATEYKGAYTYTTSVFGGYILSASLSGKQTKFLVTYHTEEIIEGEGEGKKTTEVTTYEFVEKLPGYAEYYYADNGSVYYAPLIVIDDEEAGKASVYGYTSAKTFVKVLTGSYQEKADGLIVENSNYKIALYTLTITETLTPEQEVSTALYDYSAIKSIEFALDPKASTNYNVSYWFEVTLDNGEGATANTDYTETLTDLGENTLKLIGRKTHTIKRGTLTESGMAIYSAGGQVVVGPYSMSYTASSATLSAEEIEVEFNNATAVSMSLTVGSGALYFEIDNVKRSNNDLGAFLKLQHAPMNLYRYNVDGTADQNEYIHLDGKGHADYTVVTVETVDGKENKTTAVVKGSVAATGKNSRFGSSVYIFTPDEATAENKPFAFIQLSTSSNAFFSKYEYADSDYTGEEFEGDSGLLALDGFGYAGTFTDRNGIVLNGRYLQKNNVVSFSTSEGYKYFDLKMAADGSTTFTMKGSEYPGSEQGAYIIFDNQRIVGRYIYFDGYSVAKIFEFDKEGNKVFVDENASYTVENGLITVNYTDNGTAGQYVGKTSTFTYSKKTYSTFVINKGDSIVKAYVEGSDWTVLILDDVGKAVRYKDYGTKETGTYKLITETLLYYLNDANTDACLYNFDPATGKLTLCTSLAYSYYTEDLNTLIFTKYGFVIKNGVNSFYYTTDADGKVTVYKFDEENENKNAYGFTTIDFGTFTNIVEFENETYYRDTGYDVTFTRNEGNAQKYPYNEKAITDVKFTPVGGDTYTVKATATIGGEAVAGYVVKNSEGLYLVINKGAVQYQFAITLTYRGSEEASYTIDSMRSVSSSVPYSYAQTYVMYYMFMGVAIPNNVGQIAFVKEYGETGEITSDYVTGWFNEANGYVDSMGNYFWKVEKDAEPHKIYKGNEGDKNKYYLDEEKGTCVISVTMSDGYDYEFIFAVTSFYGMQAYRTLGFIRNETLSTEDNAYTVNVKRIIASDSYKAGSYYNILLTEGGVERPYTEAYIVNGEIVYIVRGDTVNGMVSSSVHYNVVFSEKTSGDVEDTSTGVKLFDKVTVTKKTMTVIYNADKTQFVEMADGKVVSIVTQKEKDGKTTYSTIIARSCVLNEDGSYTVVTGGNITYTVTITDGVATIEKAETAQ